MQPHENPIAILGWVARARALATKSHAGAAEDWLLANGAPDKARRIYKAAIGAGSTLDSDLGEYGISIGAWSDSARTRSAFYRILNESGFTRVPIGTRIGITTVPATGTVTHEGDAVPVSKLTLQNLLLTPVKASALMVVTNELLADVSAAGQQLFNRELMGAVSDAVDAAFLDMIVSTGTTSNASSGNTAVNAWNDLRTAMLAVSAVGSARLYMIAAPDVATRAATLPTTDGAQAFVAAGPSGGELVNVPLLVSSGVPAGELYVINAAAIAADGGPVTVDVSTQADILMDTAPAMSSDTPTPAQMTSMWQSNSTALKASAWFGAQVLRDDAVAVVSDIAWGSA